MKDEQHKKPKKKKNNKDFENQIASLEESLKRALADYQNLERRVLEERNSTAKYANEKLLKTLLPSFDNLFLAEKYTEDEGVRLTVQKLIENLSEVGVRRIQTVGSAFDPETMECIEVTNEGNTVTEETRPGFLLFDKVIRPAQVKVGGRKESGSMN